MRSAVCGKRIVTQLIIINVTRKLASVCHCCHKVRWPPGTPKDTCSSRYLRVFERMNFQMWALGNQISLHSREILSCQRKRHRGCPGEWRRRWVGGREGGAGEKRGRSSSIMGLGLPRWQRPVSLKIFSHSLLNSHSVRWEWISCGNQRRAGSWDLTLLIL